MTQDPTLFTAIEWVLMAMAGLIALVLFAVVHRAEPGSPFAEREEHWLPDDSASQDSSEDRNRHGRILR
ncbi:hypothetical protein [Roseibium marinum]|uniref:Uncharacterized protein n=1 Tax=Roseibium marinum TaxID=281252 RepID=A0A2S3UMJ4_9HYPH|nr:hypothetical protein [Roseibium marinum]POF28901.1 hypothetical protein CLV41_111152 [Roseibium marinum]